MVGAFKEQSQVKIVLTTNFTDVPDPTLLCLSQLDLEIEMSEPNEVK